MMIDYYNSSLLNYQSPSKLPLISAKLQFSGVHKSGMLLKPKYDSIDYLVRKQPEKYHRIYQIEHGYEPIQEKKLVQDICSGRPLRRNSQILLGGVQVIDAPVKSQRKTSQIETQATSDIEKFFILEPPQKVEKRPQKLIVKVTKKVKRQYRLQNFTDWVEQIYGRDWFNIA